MGRRAEDRLRFARLRAFDHDSDPTAWVSGRLAGVDEAGVGPLAGPVVAAAVILPPDFELDEIDDSKRLSASERRRCERIVRAACVALAVSWVSARRIDSLNILNATLHAQRRALERLPVRPWTILVDGNRSPALPRTWRSRLRAVVGGDRSSLAIAAASVVAKSTRDRWMQRLERRYPGYGFARHKGYATTAHREAVRRLGLTPVHRRTFCGWLHAEAELARQMQLPLQTGVGAAPATADTQRA